MHMHPALALLSLQMATSLRRLLTPTTHPQGQGGSHKHMQCMKERCWPSLRARRCRHMCRCHLHIAARRAGTACRLVHIAACRHLVWDDYFMAVAFLSAQRSKDPNKQVCLHKVACRARVASCSCSQRAASVRRTGRQPGIQAVQVAPSL
jgi:hypothetical protein